MLDCWEYVRLLGTCQAVGNVLVEGQKGARAVGSFGLLVTTGKTGNSPMSDQR